MQLTELWNTHGKATLSFEVYPARTPKQEASFAKALDKLIALEPNFFGVTFGAGGSTREGSRQLVKKLVVERGQNLVAYVACFGLGPDDLRGVLNDYRELGVANVLAVRGDAPHGDEAFTPHPASLAHASDFVTFLGEEGFAESFCVGCAGYPEGHIDAASADKDLEFLKLKVDQGARYVITNYVYDNALYFDFVKRARAAGIEVPILPGVMPIYSVKMMESLAKLCGATITDELRAGLDALDPEDKGALSDFSVDFATKQCTALIEGGAPGVHIYTMDRFKAATGIVTNLRDAGLL